MTKKFSFRALAITIVLLIIVFIGAIFTMDVPFIADAADISAVDYDKYTDRQ